MSTREYLLSVALVLALVIGGLTTADAYSPDVRVAEITDDFAGGAAGGDITLGAHQIQCTQGTSCLSLDTDATSYLYASGNDAVAFVGNASLTVPAAMTQQWTGRTILSAPADGDLLITNAAATYALRIRATADGAATLYNATAGASATLTASGFNGTSYVRSGTTVKTQLGSFGATEMKTPASATLTFAGGAGDASKTATGLIPAGCFLVGITSRVATTGTTCTSMDIGTAGDPDGFANDTSVTDNATSDNTDVTTTALLTVYPAATDVVVTGVGGNCVSLVVNVYAHCMTVTAAIADL
jgi:hypothetical protein